jgi:nucleotide-binding universal stress UspA family protein
MMDDYPILVGYDGSTCGGSALRWALAEAARRSAPVRLVYVHEWAVDTRPVPAGSTWPHPGIRRHMAEAVDRAAATARSDRPEVILTASVIDGPTVPTLRKLSEKARLLVVGCRGLGGFTGLLAGSVATGVAAHARCPVVVVRGCARPALPVAVGLDDSPDADQAVGLAFDQAAARGVGLVAVRGWQPAPVPRSDDAGPLVFDAEALAAAERRLSEHALLAWQEKYPQVPVTMLLRADRAAGALVAASTGAQLLVVGARGRGGFAGLPLGSATRQVIDHSRCPVLIVRDLTGQHE